MTEKLCSGCLSQNAQDAKFCGTCGAAELLDDFDSSSPLAGTVIDDRYVMLAELGQGGMGVVYRAWQRSIGREVALKLIREDRADEAMGRRFIREAQVTAKLRSLHTVTVYDFGKLPDGSLYMVMEFLNGPPLSAVRKSEGPIEIARLCRWGSQICDSLAEAHGLGLVHRDLKPANVILSRLPNGTEHVTVLDFGVVKLMDLGREKLTRTGASLGSLAYMSPEQIDGREVGPSTDIYALGVTLYDLAAGGLPFRGPTDMALMFQHMSQPPPRLTTLIGGDNPAVAALDDIIQRAMHKRPSDRFSSVQAFAKALNALASPGVHAVEVSSGETDEEAPGAALDPMADPAMLVGVTTAKVHQRINENLTVVEPPRVRRGFRWSPSTVAALVAILFGLFIIGDSVLGGGGCSAVEVGANDSDDSHLVNDGP